jgi:tetratricopeptide (TPR) repeat protein
MYYMPERVAQAMRLHKRGLALLEEGDADGAIAAFRAELAELHDFPDLAQVVRGSLGDALCRKGSYEEAIGEFRKALIDAPESGAAHVNLAYALSGMREFDAAFAEAQCALALVPDDPFLHFLLGGICQEKGDLEAAINSWRQALSLDPNHAQARVSLARALEGSGRPFEAAAEYRELMRMRPDDAEPRDALIGVVADGLVRLAEDLTDTASKETSTKTLSTGESRTRILDELLCMNLAAVGLAPLLVLADDERKDRIIRAARKALGSLINRRVPDTAILAEYDERAKAYFDAYTSWHTGPGHPSEHGPVTYDAGPGVTFAEFFCGLGDVDLWLWLMTWSGGIFTLTLYTACMFVRDCLGLQAPVAVKRDPAASIISSPADAERLADMYMDEIHKTMRDLKGQIDLEALSKLRLLFGSERLRGLRTQREKDGLKSD